MRSPRPAQLPPLGPILHVLTCLRATRILAPMARSSRMASASRPWTKAPSAAAPRRFGRTGTGARTGTFALQHSGTMNRGAPTLTLTVVPDSGTDELTGLTGSMKIIIASGKHSYEFEYELPGD